MRQVWVQRRSKGGSIAGMGEAESSCVGLGAGVGVGTSASEGVATSKGAGEQCGQGQDGRARR